MYIYLLSDEMKIVKDKPFFIYIYKLPLKLNE